MARGQGGDYLWYRTQHKDVSLSRAIGPTVADPQTLVTVGNQYRQIFLQQAKVAVTTYAAETWTLQDSAGAPVPGAVIQIPATGTALKSESGSIDFTFDPQGVSLTIGTNLVLKRSGTAASGQLSIGAYEQFVGPAPAGREN